MPLICFVRCLRRYAAMALLFCFDGAHAVDFKIDLPPDMGQKAPARDVVLEDFDFPDDLGVESFQKENFSGRSGAARLPDASVINGVQNLSFAPFVSSESKISDSSFPALKCLAGNVKFWEAVYRDVDTDSVLLHDREDLGRIYGVAKLSSNAATRNYSADVYRNYFSTKLRELASLYDRPSEWDSAHRDLARLFPGKLLAPDVLLRASRNIRIQSGLKSNFEAGIQRSLPIMNTVHRVISQQGLPEDIVLLPHVESSYHLRATSKVGAVGLWQIMPDTMRMLMGRNSVSRRTEVEASTMAAAKLLKQNYRQTKSWPLALTAYNHGLNGVMKAIRKTGSTDLCTIIERYDSRSFQFASSNFYAQFVAARNVSLERYADLMKKGTGPKALKPLLARRLGSRL
jgi:membrane-bound lytic murein transglycosylase D